MEVVVLVKYVPDSQSTGRFVPPAWTVDRVGTDGLLSELDEHAVEAAMQISEAHGGSVTAVTMGPPPADAAVQGALRLGAQAGVHIVDDVLAGSDTLATSLVLAVAVRRLNPDLVITGMASTDAGTSAIPAMIAERLSWPQLTFAQSLQVEGGTVRVERDRRQHVETIEAQLPAVVGVTDRCNEPRYPSFRTILAAKKKAVTVWSLADLSIDPSLVGAAAARTTVCRATTQPSRPAGQVLIDNGDAGKHLVDYLASAGLL